MGIYDNLNTAVPNLIQGSNLNNAAYQLGNAIDKTFGNAQGGILDFWKGQQDDIQARNTTIYQNAVKGLTAEQLRQLEEQGINPYTDLPGLMGYGKGILLDTDKAFESAANAGTALTSANNTWLSQQLAKESPDELRKAAASGDATTYLMNKYKSVRPNLNYYDENAFVTKGNEAGAKGFQYLADTATENNKLKELNDRLAGGEAGYDLTALGLGDQALDPGVGSRLRQQLHQNDINLYSKLAAAKIKEWQYLNGSEDWGRAMKELGINPQWVNSDVLKEAGVFTTEGQDISRKAATLSDDITTSIDTNSTKRSNNAAERAKAATQERDSEQELADDTRTEEQAQAERDAEDSIKQRVNTMEEFTPDSFADLNSHVQDLRMNTKIPEEKLQEMVVKALGSSGAYKYSDNLFKQYVENNPKITSLFKSEKDSSGRDVIDLDKIEAQRQVTFKQLEKDLENKGYDRSIIEMSKKLFEQKWNTETEHARWFNTVSHNRAAMDANREFEKAIAGNEYAASTAYTFLNNTTKGSTTDPYSGYSIKNQVQKDALWEQIEKAIPKGTNAQEQFDQIRSNPEAKNYLIRLYLYEAAATSGADTAEKVVKSFNKNNSHDLTNLVHYAYKFNKMARFAQSPEDKINAVKPSK